MPAAEALLQGQAPSPDLFDRAADAVLDGDASAVGSWSAKFAGIMLPGETLRVRIWRDGDRDLVTAESVERAAPVLADAVFTAR